MVASQVLCVHMRVLLVTRNLNGPLRKAQQASPWVDFHAIRMASSL